LFQEGSRKSDHLVLVVSIDGGNSKIKDVGFVNVEPVKRYGSVPALVFPP
jgi:hypothetical protein